MSASREHNLLKQQMLKQLGYSHIAGVKSTVPTESIDPSGRGKTAACNGWGLDAELPYLLAVTPRSTKSRVQTEFVELLLNLVNSTDILQVQYFYKMHTVLCFVD